ncbi:hypothetical protein IWW50_001646 [Coemansia erecta]|nr:hypothetical protein GGF43_001777 [Coemansia sp. RSA 2618]KAJ2827908.1 hypothetical protein IWW50_001646 [Coemansia erecta]
MVQSINIAGLRTAWTLLARPSLLMPDIAVSDIRSLSWTKLRSRGVRYLVFDKDNCLTAPYANHIHPEYSQAWAECLREFPDRVLVVSNSAGTHDDPGFRAAHEVEAALGVPVLRHREKKPRCGQEILRKLGARAEEVAVVGDRLATDVAMANMYGMTSVWVQNIVTRRGDNSVAAALRDVEHVVYRIAKRMQRS